MVVTQFGSMFKHPSFIHVKGGGHQLLGCCCFSLQRQIPSWWCWGVCFSPYLQRNVEHDYWPRVLQVQAFLHQHHWPVSCKSWTKNPYITSLSLVKAFTNSFLDPVEMVRSNFCLWKTQDRDLNLVLLLPDPCYHSPSVGGSPETHKASPIPTQKMMSAGWNWPHSGCGHGTDTKEADSAHSQIIFTVFPCWNLWEG